HRRPIPPGSGRLHGDTHRNEVVGRTFRSADEAGPQGPAYDLSVRSTMPRMDTGDLRKRILFALDAARKDSSDRRRLVDDAGKAYETFLANIAVPMIKQAASVLCAEKQRF